MKKFDMNRYKMEFMEKFAFDFKEWMSPAIRDYYSLFIKKAHNNRTQLLSWVKEYSILKDGRSVSVEQKPVNFLPKQGSFFYY
ncbi:hypothetical protein [Psychromonas sp. MME2]|uniref:hypothetical protein n=1 Tax=Psychromonas sp. MME2 TaxID=3231033 RepID=UPI00339D1149